MNEAVCGLAEVCVCSPEASLFPPLIISQRATEIYFTGKNAQWTNWNNTYVFLISQKDHFDLSQWAKVEQEISLQLVGKKETIFQDIIAFN